MDLLPLDDAHDATLLAGSASISQRQAPERIGAYRLCRRLGSGGMGDVWLAEQERPVRREVALKLIKLGMDTREVVARFESELQALAALVELYRAWGKPAKAREYERQLAEPPAADRATSARRTSKRYRGTASSSRSGRPTASP